MKVLFVKVKLNTDIHKNIEASMPEGRYIYNTSNVTQELYNIIYKGLGDEEARLKTVFIINQNDIPVKVYIAQSEKLITNSNMLCDIAFEYENKHGNEIATFLEDINLDLEKSFAHKEYIILKEVNDNQFMEFIKKISPPYEVEILGKKEQKYDEIVEENNLDELAQKNNFCLRVIGIQGNKNSRNEFQRDRERVIHSKAYRRLVDKAQIFTSSKGDHFRTRMTHTLEVSQIARGISSRLKLNNDLTEAIALAHDIGHTPFGHQGERTLNKILKGDIPLICGVDKIEFGGFKHNYQGVRVVNNLEEKYIEHEGLDLSYQTLEGILKHTGGKVRKCSLDKNNVCLKCTHNCYDINEFLIQGDVNELYLKNENPTTLEAQIVRIADEIAQRGHDLDDAFAARALSIDKLKKDASKVVELDVIIKMIEKIEKEIKEYEEKGRIFVDKLDMFRARFTPSILGYFINDVIENSKKLMSEYKTTKMSFFEQNHRVDEMLIGFSKDSKLVLEILENIITSNVINSYEVSRFDDKAEKIITALFRAYYTNPKLLADNVLIKIQKDIHNEFRTFVNFREDSPAEVNKELINITQYTDEQEKNKFLEQEYARKRHILVRNIADYIGGMTDSFALKEYAALLET